MGISVVIFDLDGTLVDSSIDLGLSVIKAINKNGYSCSKNPIDYLKFVGNGTLKLVERSCLEYFIPEKLVSKIYEDFTSIYNTDFLNNTKEYDGIRNLLQELKLLNYKLAVLTNKPNVISHKIVNTLFPNTFDYILGQVHRLPIKPNVEFLDSLLEAVNSQRSNAVICGDSRVDIQTARNAGIPCISVGWGFEKISVLEKINPNYIVEFPKDIKKKILDIDRN